MRSLLVSAICAALGLVVCAPAGADVFGPIALVSASLTEQANYAHDPAISGNGVYVAFDGYFDGETGVWRRDLLTGAVEAVAVGEPRAPAGSADLPSISDNGQYISFTTTAPLSPANDKNPGPDVYVRNMAVAESQPCEERALRPEQPCAYTLASAVSESTEGLTYAYEGTEGRENDERLYGSRASGRSALSADGKKVVFVTSAISNLTQSASEVEANGAQPTTSPLEVAVRDLETGTTELVSVAYDPATGEAAEEHGHPVPVLAQSESAGSNPPFGAVYTSGGPPIFKGPEPYKPTPELGASISADGSTVAWMGQNIGEQARTLPGESLDPRYSEPLWRRIADGEQTPTRRITGGSDPANGACASSGETALAQPASLADPCQGPFSTETHLGTWNGGNGASAIPRLSADGYTVAFLATAPLMSLGSDFGSEAANRHSDLYVASMHEGLSRVQALRPLTELASGNEQNEADDAQIEDEGISADGTQVAFTTRRTAFPLSSPAYVSAPAAVPGMLELFDVDLADDTLTRVTHGYEGGASEHPHPTLVAEDQYEQLGDGALSPSFSEDGNTLAFSSTASNLVYGDGNTPPVGAAGGLDGSDVFEIDRIVFDATPAPQLISAAPSGPPLAPTWSLGVTARSLANGSVRLYIEVPGAGTLHAAASDAVAVRTAHVSRGASRARPGVHATTVLRIRTVASATHPIDGEGALTTLTLTLAPNYRRLAEQPEGLSARTSIYFTAPGHPSLHSSIVVSFRRAGASRHSRARARRSGRRGR